MERREFLIGLFGTATAALTPQIIETVLAASPQETWEAFLKQWHLDSMPVFVDYQTNAILFGLGTIRATESYPYVESIHPCNIVVHGEPNAYCDHGLELLVLKSA